MSKGDCAYANLVLLDESMLVYEYCCYQIKEDWKEKEKVVDGELYIDPTAIVEPEIHEKIKKYPTGRKKLITKRILNHDFDIDSLFEEKRIVVKNASGEWTFHGNGLGHAAYHLLWKLFVEYQETGEIPLKLYWFI